MMGCDIHLHVEIRLKRNVKDGFGKWFNGDIFGEFSDQNYKMFAYLADVRADGDDKPIVPDRGLPDDVGESTKGYFMHPIIQEDKGFEYFFGSPIRPVTEETANIWVEKYKCKIEDCKFYKVINDPDYHSFNWCKTNELEKCIEKAENSIYGVNVSWKALLNYMKTYEENGYEVRAVYWFDS